METKFPKKEGDEKLGNQEFLKKLERGTHLGGHCVIRFDIRG